MAVRLKFGQMLFHRLVARDIDGATHELLNLVKGISNSSTIYFDGWNGLGVVAVLRSIAQELRSMNDPPPELCFNRIIYIDCSTLKSKRAMQRRIAEELKLDCKAMFDKQDEEDDFNGVDTTSRDVVQGIAALINRTLRDISFIMIFLNGNDEEVVLSRFGVPEYHDHIIIWTFKKRFPTKGLLARGFDSIDEIILNKLRHTDIFLGYLEDVTKKFTYSEISALVREEAASILTHHPHMLDDDVEIMVTNCFLYGLFLHQSFHEGTGQLWATHGATYWICDGIIQGNRTREISKMLYHEVSFKCDDDAFLGLNHFRRQIRAHWDSSYLLCDEDDDDDDQDNNNNDPSQIKGKKPHCWISTTSNKTRFLENLKNILERASLIFLPFKITDTPIRLPHDLIEKCNNLRVLILSYCAFNFVSPLFCHCNTLRFLGLDHCINNYTTELQTEDNITKWTCLQNLWVLDLRYTNWDDILPEEKMDLMGNIMELNIEGFICWQYIAEKLEGRLPYLERLRIVKPLHQVEASMEIDSSFMGKTKLEVLDLSGNRDIKKLPISLSKVRSLEVLVLDGCDGLENVVLSNSMIRSFSFDGYGPASNWTSMDELPLESSRLKCPNDDDKKDAKVSLVTLAGCTHLRNLFLRGLPNLVELDLSGCAVKILDFQTMVVGVPRLKRLFLLGCEQLRAIIWMPPIYTIKKKSVSMPVDLKLLCIDTRHGGGVSRHTRLSIFQEPDKNFGLQVHAATTDARFVRSLFVPIAHHVREEGMPDCFFDIRIISSNIICNEKPSEEHHEVVASSPYDDVSTEVGDSCLTPMQAFPRPPASRLDHHIEIGEGSCNVASEVEVLSTDSTLVQLMMLVQSLHVHDTSTSVAMPTDDFEYLKWCHVERCSRLDPVFPSAVNAPKNLETIWASDLLTARCIWSKSELFDDKDTACFESLQHLHLCSCSSLQFALPVWTSSFPMLETLHIMHCGSLRHVFALDNNKYDINSRIRFPKLTTIHLHNVPALRQICEAKMIAPKLKTIKTRGCWSLRRLPALELKGRRVGLERHRRSRWWNFEDDSGGDEEDERRRPTVEMEKDVWDALEWDGVKAGHHPSLYEAPVYSRYYKRRGLLRRTVLR